MNEIPTLKNMYLQTAKINNYKKQTDLIRAF